MRLLRLDAERQRGRRAFGRAPAHPGPGVNPSRARRLKRQTFHIGYYDPSAGPRGGNRRGQLQMKRSRPLVE